MEVSARSLAKGAVNWVFGPLGMEVVRKDHHDWSDTRNFIPIETTLAGARNAGLSVGDYIDTVLNNLPGSTQFTIDEMRTLGVFAAPVETVLEIGPGSGRYLEKTIDACSPRRYEIYETSQPWAAFLAGEYQVIQQPTDGVGLSSTPDASCDLVHAHKVFSSIPFMPTIKYWGEMARVARTGAHIVFDIMTEACLDNAIVSKWAASGIDNGAYPAAMPRQVALDVMAKHGCAFIGSFLVPMGEGHTETFVFRKL